MNERLQQHYLDQEKEDLILEIETRTKELIDYQNEGDVSENVIIQMAKDLDNTITYAKKLGVTINE